MSEIPLSMTIERYELKYLIPRELVTPLSAFIEGYCQLDPHSQNSPDHFYTVNNLYLGSSGLASLAKVDQRRAFHFDLRVRSYGAASVAPVFLEIKYRVRDFVKKKRSLIVGEGWRESLSSGFVLDTLDVDSRRNLEDFSFMIETYKMAPLLTTQYQRKAYNSVVGDSSRITLDQDLCFQPTRDWQLASGPESMTSDSSGAVILELKWEHKIPLWMIDLIRKFELRAIPFSKLDHSLEHFTKSCETPDPVFFQKS